MKVKKQGNNNNFISKLILGCTTLIALLAVQSATAADKFFIPSNPQPGASLFVVIHGCLSNAEDIEKTSRFSEFAETHGFYVLYPEPTLTEAKGCYEFYTQDSQKPGMGEATVIVNKVQQYLQQYDIDANKVFVAGMSAGSSIIPTLISCYPTVFHGAAMHSGMGYGLTSTWQESIWVAQAGPMKTKPRNNFCAVSDYKGKVFLIQGTDDKIMNPKNFALLKKDYFTGLDITSERVPATSSVYGYKRSYYSKNNEVVGQALKVYGMAHDWSGGEPQCSLSLYGPDVTPMIIDFFTK